MPRVNYPAVIQDSGEELAQLARQLRGHPTAPRVQLLRVLKSGHVTTLGAAASLLGFSERTSARWWSAYRRGGLDQLLDNRTAPGRVSSLSEEA